MPMTPLIAAVRHNDAGVVRKLIVSGVDVNEMCEVEPAVQRRQESPLYVTTAFFEAVRQRNKEVASILLSRPDIDVNRTATVLELTPFCDAVSRGDVDMVQFLLADSRIDPTLGSRIVSRPCLYAAMNGNTVMLRCFADAKLISDDVESALYKTAAANGHTEALHFVENYFIDIRPLEKLTPGRQLVKIRREFAKFDDDGNGFCDNGELRDLFTALGVPLSEEELHEAFMTLNTAGDNRIDLDELTSYWLGPDAFKSALVELQNAGGYGGFNLDAASGSGGGGGGSETGGSSSSEGFGGAGGDGR